MSEPEDFLTRWSRLKRESDAIPEAKPAASPDGAPPPAATAAPGADEPAFDLSKLPSLDSISADTDVSMFMRPGVPASLRHAALRRAWASDPTIRDFRGPQEADWDFTAPDGVPGFGTFKSESEIKELAQRLFGGESHESEAVPQSAPQDSQEHPVADHGSASDVSHDENQPSRAEEAASDRADSTAVQQDDDAAVQHVAARRHGGALPQ